jgi:D-threo-aldose 1-dehydrogenase
MKIITLRNTDIQTTTLGFGCGGLMRIPTERRRQRVLAEAFDAGIRHFDVARMYGLGKVESEVGAFIRGRREHFVLATKFGIEVKQASRIASAVQGVGRRVIAMLPALRRAVRKRSQSFYAPKNFDVATARRSLEESLRALQTDYIDIFLLHEPELADVKDTAVWEYLQRAKEAGLIRAWGVAGYPGQIGPICEQIPELAKIIQLPNDVVNRQLEKFRSYSNSAFITFSPYSEALGMTREFLTVKPSVAEKYIDNIGIDMRGPGNLAKLILGYCLHANRSGVTLFSSSRPEGIREGVEIWNNPLPDESIQAFANFVTNEVVKAQAARVSDGGC